MRQLAANLLRRWFPAIDAINGVACWWCGCPDPHDDETGCQRLGCGCTGLL